VQRAALTKKQKRHSDKPRFQNQNSFPILHRVTVKSIDGIFCGTA